PAAAATAPPRRYVRRVIVVGFLVETRHRRRARGAHTMGTRVMAIVGTLPSIAGTRKRTNKLCESGSQPRFSLAGINTPFWPCAPFAHAAYVLSRTLCPRVRAISERMLSTRPAK